VSSSHTAAATSPLDRALAGAARATDDEAVRRWLTGLLRHGEHAEGVVGGRDEQHPQDATRTEEE
jgi:hypothetical protein